RTGSARFNRSTSNEQGKAIAMEWIRSWGSQPEVLKWEVFVTSRVAALEPRRSGFSMTTRRSNLVGALRLQNISKTGEDSRGLQCTPEDNKLTTRQRAVR